MNFLFYRLLYVVIHWRMKLVFHGGLRQIHTLMNGLSRHFKITIVVEVL